MTVRLRLRLNVAVSLIVLTVLGVVFVDAIYRVRVANMRDQIAAEIVRNLFERSTLRDEYIQYNEERSKSQWEEKRHQFESLIDTAEERFDKHEERAILSEMLKNHESGWVVFHAIADNRQKEATGENSAAISKEIESRLVSQILLKSYDIYIGAVRLQEAADRAQASAQTRALMLSVVFVAVIVTTVMANSVSINSLITKRINRLMEGARLIAGGNFDHQIDISGNDEFSELSKAFNNMTNQLSRSHGDIRELNRDLQQNVIQLEAANKELEAFSYSVSHDLRAPLRHMSGFVELLNRRMPKELDEKSRHYLAVISDSARQMGRLVDDLLSFSRMGRTEMMRSRIDSERLVSAVIEELSPDTTGRDIRWQIGHLPGFFGDPAMMKLVFINLISNALKFSMPRSPAMIELGCVTTETEHVFHVKDNGVGFDMRYLDKLFGLFQRLHRPEEFEGTGVGLANVRRIISRHGGRTWAEGEVGNGATFYFSLPNSNGG